MTAAAPALHLDTAAAVIYLDALRDWEKAFKDKDRRVILPAAAASPARRMRRTRHQLRFKETDLCRAVKACRKAGLDVARVEIASDGKIVVIAKTGNGDSSGVAAGHNEWDQV
jgi:hypothetical protein